MRMMWNFANLFHTSSAVNSGNSQYINRNHNCIKYLGWCGLLGHSIRRGRIHVWVLTLRSLHGARKSNQIRVVATYHARFKIEGEIHWSQKSPVACSRRGRGWMEAHQRLAELIILTELQTVPHCWLGLLNVRECAGLKCSLQVYCWLYWCMNEDSPTIPS